MQVCLSGAMEFTAFFDSSPGSFHVYCFYGLRILSTEVWQIWVGVELRTPSKTLFSVILPKKAQQDWRAWAKATEELGLRFNTASITYPISSASIPPVFFLWSPQNHRIPSFWCGYSLEYKSCISENTDRRHYQIAFPGTTQYYLSRPLWIFTSLRRLNVIRDPIIEVVHRSWTVELLIQAWPPDQGVSWN